MDVKHHVAGNDFVWYASKATSNLRKHGIRFEDAATVFLDPLLVLMNATRKNEARDAAIGFDHSGRLLFVVHIEFDGDYIRLISARPADPAEEVLYAQ